MIEQLFTNLISNAVKYSKDKAQSIIKISSSINKNEIVYQVSDNGIGMDMKEIDKVFQIFSRLSNSKEFEGSGVGMAIAKKITDRHNGRIWVESKLGEGSTFYVTFPRQPEADRK